ncbi:ArsS family sensor histidine kinase [Poseidonibacter ostreae]|jgi:two-component system, OmpR family, sensor kinase|uniref:histidine kinase n=1 Tax=Poseidonibacter ostreae TaxID=2654171 RepID=A0A6L4WNM3_9BACT|nr:ArsS family sensor histidine kinase [Poseidonibacter ostreae]KAB7884787.1 HAMP domain-containing protein [Poseidonibacter ostreae]KAB7886660.1 HAMP domain-containing protein [Poseidonibacter ostreae]KAB7891809.1 HAMP domain-containing protein [Poseidonibacter ostreae]MAC83390.1 two-component sensor histidine kinase [Arcobacter sp.]|tara:strand:+ start:2575 stop:3792 length:1218 start_codon:yes stop_codon:yes gene_type:complete
MIRNISISTFINIIFSLAFIATVITFSLFISFDKQKHEINQQNRYELIAENFLSTFQNLPTAESLINLFKKFQVRPLENRDDKLKIIKNAQELTITQNYLGTYRVYKYDAQYYIYVQQYGYNLMLKDIRNSNYSMAIIISAFVISLITIFFLYAILKRKLKPLKLLNKQIIEFSNGNKDIKIKAISNDEIGTIAKSFNEAIRLINNQSKSKDLFMRNMMHELKTPITKAMFIAETLQNEQTRDNLQRAFKRMDDIIKELATVEKLTSANSMMYKEQTSFFNIYTKTLEIMMISPENIASKIKGFQFEVDVSMFSIALKNLIDNAIKFSPNNKAIINASKEQIEISSLGEPLKYDLDYYTEAFSQEEKRSDGFGLGLYIVKTIVNLHGYKFTYHYKDGKNYFCIKM